MENKLSYSMNVFAPTEEIKGRKVLPANTESFSAMVDSTQDGVLLAGDPVKIVANSAKLPHIAKAAVGDVVMGFVEFNVIRNGYASGDVCQISPAGNVMYMEANGAVDAGVAINIADLANVRVAKAGSGKSVLGHSLESATAQGQLIRVKIGQPVALTANA